MAHVLEIDRLQLYVQFERPLDAVEIDAVRQAVRRRGDGEPVAYIVESRGFRDLAFSVDRRVLVPRPETELLVDVALPSLQAAEGLWLLDVGTGSGCVAISLLREVPGSRAVATDVSGDALVVAAANASRHEVTDRITLCAGDLLAPARDHEAWGAFACVVSNPPYVTRDDPELADDVRRHEPAQALFVPGDDPLEVASRIATDARDALAPGGLLALEIGHRSGGAAHDLLASLGYADVALHKDLAGIDRVVSGHWRDSSTTNQ